MSVGSCSQRAEHIVAPPVRPWQLFKVLIIDCRPCQFSKAAPPCTHMLPSRPAARSTEQHADAAGSFSGTLLAIPIACAEMQRPRRVLAASVSCRQCSSPTHRPQLDWKQSHPITCSLTQQCNLPPPLAGCGCCSMSRRHMSAADAPARAASGTAPGTPRTARHMCATVRHVCFGGFHSASQTATRWLEPLCSCWHFHMPCLPQEQCNSGVGARLLTVE